MRIVYLSGSARLGGAERCLLDVMETVRAERPAWSLSLVATSSGPLVEDARARGFSVDVVPFPPDLALLGDSRARGNQRRLLAVGVRAVGAVGSIARYRNALRRSLATSAPDVVHSNGYKTHILGAWTRPRCASLVWHLHDYLSTRPVMARAMRWHAAQCDGAIAVSESVGRDVQTVCGGRLPLQVVLNGVDLDTFRPDGPRADLDALAGLPPAPDGVVRVGLVATLGWFKGHEVFLRAIARLPHTLMIRAYVVSGPLYETRGSEVALDTLRALAADLGIADRVGFTGFLAEPATAMRALDVVVHASTMPEPFGLVIAEAMGCGRPVIVSSAGGAGEIVRAGLDALTHPPGDTEALAVAIETLATNSALRARLGQEGRRSAVSRFDRRRMAAHLVPMYTALTARSGSARRSG